jgi:cell division protein FtsB
MLKKFALKLVNFMSSLLTLCKKMFSFRVVLIAFVLILVFILVTQSLTIIQLRYKTNDLNEQMLDYQNKSKLLTEKLEQVGTEKYVEEIARTKLGMTKSGETPVKIMLTTPEIQDQAFEAVSNNHKVGIYLRDWYVKVKEWVKGSKK